MHIEITIDFKEVENWDVNWDDPEEQDKAFREIRKQVREVIINNLALTGNDVKVSKPNIIKPWPKDKNGRLLENPHKKHQPNHGYSQYGFNKTKLCQEIKVK